jgi:hypothetical protein
MRLATPTARVCNSMNFKCFSILPAGPVPVAMLAQPPVMRASHGAATAQRVLFVPPAPAPAVAASASRAQIPPVGCCPRPHAVPAPTIAARHHGSHRSHHGSLAHPALGVYTLASSYRRWHLRTFCQPPSCPCTARKCACRGACTKLFNA